MIQTSKQLEATRRQIEKFQEWRDEVLLRKDRDPLEVHMVVAGIEGMIERMEKEIEQFENAMRAPDYVSAAH